MRKVGEIHGKDHAVRFAGFLGSRGVAAELHDEGDDRYHVWVLDEDRVGPAEEALKVFLANPADKRFDSNVKVHIGPTPAPEPRPAAREIPFRPREAPGGIGRLTLAIVLLCVLIMMMQEVATMRWLVSYLYYSHPGFPGRGFPEILDGQVWRLVTPVLMHGGVFHLVFNMIWLLQLGTAVERNEGPGYLLGLMLVVAVIVNTSQYLVSGPAFLGMSGVIYALLGYVYVMSRYHVGSSYALHQQTMVIMLVWLVICLVGIIPNVANTQHIMGLVSGAAWGFLRSGHLKTLRRRRQFKGKL